MSNSASSAALRDLESELAQLVRTLDSTYRRRGHPMERAHYLLLLELLDGPRASGDLAQRLGLDHSTVTRQITAIRRLGYVRSLPNPDDGRSTLIEATEEGRRTCSEMQAVRLERLDALLEGWDTGERARFADDLHRLNGALRRRATTG